MRRWLDTFAGGSPPWPAHMRGAAPLLANLDLEMPQVGGRALFCVCLAVRVCARVRVHQA
jgi:hypothetical protein